MTQHATGGAYGAASRLNDGIDDRGQILFPGYYSLGYPWETRSLHGSYISIAQDGKDVLQCAKHYTPDGCRLRDAIRHAEICGQHVPQSAYDWLGTLTWVAYRARAQSPSSEVAYG